MPIKATRHRPARHAPDDESPEGPPEIAMVGDLSENESDVYDKMLSLNPGSDCTLYINCPGGVPIARSP